MENILLINYSRQELKELLAEVLKELSASPFHSVTAETDSELLTIEQAIKLLKISKPTLWAYSKYGLVKKHKLGSKVFYKRSELLKAVEEVLPLKHKKRGYSAS